MWIFMYYNRHSLHAKNQTDAYMAFASAPGCRALDRNPTDTDEIYHLKIAAREQVALAG
jgi:hypothetical protein